MAASLIGTTQQAAASIFLAQGVAVVPGAVKNEMISICRDAAAAALACSDAAITNNIRDLDATAPGAHHQAVRLHRRDFAEYLKRDGGRVDLRFNDAAPFDALLRETTTAVLDVATEALGGSANLLYSGVMVARASTGDHQNYHKDGNHENESDEPHALTVFVPLQPLTAANGPTEFRLGSHRRRADAKRLRQDGVAVMCDAGDALLFDYRVDHRGLANASEEDRLVFFCAFARPSFRDEKNARSTVPLFPASHVALTWDRGETSCVLFELTVDGVGTIRVCEGDAPEAVAEAFCSKHDLPSEAAAPLAAAIEQQMEMCKNVSCYSATVSSPLVRRRRGVAGCNNYASRARDELEGSKQEDCRGREGDVLCPDARGGGTRCESGYRAKRARALGRHGRRVGDALPGVLARVRVRTRAEDERRARRAAARDADLRVNNRQERGRKARARRSRLSISVCPRRSFLSHISPCEVNIPQKSAPPRSRL